MHCRVSDAGLSRILCPAVAFEGGDASVAVAPELLQNTVSDARERCDGGRVLSVARPRPPAQTLGDNSCDVYSFAYVRAIAYAASMHVAPY
jgi:hypothetical protein